MVVDADLDRVLEPGDDDLGWLAQRGPRAARLPRRRRQDGTHVPRHRRACASRCPATGPGSAANGEIELLGRDSVTINSGGEKIFAEEVEKAIGSHPAVYDVVVVGRPSERWGSEVVALVQVHDGMTVTEDELLEECAKHISRYKLPKAFLFRPSIQRSPAGKADYRWAKALAAESVA